MTVWSLRGLSPTPDADHLSANRQLELLVATSRSRLAVKTGRTVSLRYASTAPARSTLTVSDADQIRRDGPRHRGQGRETITWTGRTGKRPAPAGDYRLTVKALGSDGQTDATTVSLTHRRR